jgi:hypothetical protein
MAQSVCDLKTRAGEPEKRLQTALDTITTISSHEPPKPAVRSMHDVKQQDHQSWPTRLTASGGSEARDGSTSDHAFRI